MKKLTAVLGIAAIGVGSFVAGTHVLDWIKTRAMGPGESSGNWFATDTIIPPDHTDARLFGGATKVMGNLQGLNEQDWEAFLHADQGSAIAPYDLFVNLEAADGDDLFIAPRTMASLRFLSSAKSAANPDGLPVGFSRTEKPWKGEYYAGMTCMACHSGMITHKGHAMFIMGGATLADFEAMTVRFSDALSATLQDNAKFERLAERMGYTGGDAKADLRAIVQTASDDISHRVQVNATEHAYGFGRVDAVGQIYNMTAGVNLGITENLADPNAPVSYPFIWGTSQSDVVQWTGFAPNYLPEGVLLRNAGEVLGVFGRIDLMDKSNPLRPGYPSSVNVLNLGNIGSWVNQLEPPAWPAHALGPVDQQKAALGAGIYADLCAECHKLVEPFEKYSATLVKVEDIGTDPLTAANSLDTGRTKSGFRMLKLLLAITQSLETVAYHPIEAIRAGRKEAIISGIGLPGWDTYKARPLNGIWASPPFLHNGSVPTLHDMFLPSHERPKSFSLGWWEFDPAKVGYAPYEGEDAYRFDTTLPGNSNAGHEGARFGTHLSPHERSALVEYLKTL